MKEHQELFNHLADEHNLILVESELQEIVNSVNQIKTTKKTN
jgi:hypothetical protein